MANGDVWLIDYQANHKRVQSRIRAKSLKEAKAIRQEAIVELRRTLPLPQEDQERLNADFDKAWEKLHSDLLADDVSHTSMLRNDIVFRRIKRFRDLRFPNTKNVSQITLPFFLEYKAWFINELKHNPKGGWRSELICIKAMMRRFKKLGFCGREIIESFTEIKRPRHEKKDYPDIPNSKLKEMLDFIKQDRPDYYPIIRFICGTGRRIKETTLIQRKDVVWD